MNMSFFITFLSITYLKLLPVLTSTCKKVDLDILWVHTVNFYLIIKAYPAIKNPGPNFKNELTVYYQNIQGLIPFGQLGKEHPVFNNAKLIELHHYVESRVPDIVVLNETWLKESINSSEILLSKLNTIFRRDRCPDSHPTIRTITFDIKIKCSRRSMPKRKMYNFNRADWPKIKSYLDSVDWESELDTKEPDISWMNFKSILSTIIDKHVPMVNIKTEFKLPWFDSECFQKCKEKEKLHREFKTNKCPKTEMKFKLWRKEFKNLVKTKMRANLCDSNRNKLAKKCWSHIKSALKNTRVPETVYLGGK